MQQTANSEHERRSMQLSLFESPAVLTGDDELVAEIGLDDAHLSLDFSHFASRPWTPREYETWAPSEDIRVSTWAEQNRMLSAKQSAAPGPWSNKGYYVVEVMDCFTQATIENITIMASVQSSKTEAFYNMLGYAIDQDAAPALVVMPTGGTLKRVNRRIRTMIEESPAIARHRTGDPDDETFKEIALDNMTVHFATAGSSADLRNVIARYVFLDETDAYESDVDEEGSPIQMAEDRATTFWNRKVVTCCTPTTEAGYINVEYQRSDRRKFYVPCPHCRGYQILSFWRVKCRGADLGKWPKHSRDPELIKAERLARYECEHCGAEIEDRDKPWMLLYGTWVAEGQTIERDGTCSIPRPVSSHAGFWWNALYSPWRTFSEVAAKFFSTKDDPKKYKVFVNLWLAEPWKEVIVTATETEIYQARCSLPPQIVPQEAVALTCGIDVQKYGFWFAVRAWARDFTSWLIHYGHLPIWDDVENLLFETSYPIDGADTAARIWRAGFDTGGGKYEESNAAISSTEQTYMWLRKNSVGRGCRCWGTKGSSSQLAGKLHVGRPLDKTPSGRPIPGGLQLVMLDTNKLKDTFQYRLGQAVKSNAQKSDAVLSQAAFLHSATDQNYVSHILAEEKRKDRRGNEEYVQLRRENHLLDCEIIAHALADPEWPGGGVNLVRPRGDVDGKQQPGQPRKVIKSKWMEGGA